MLIQDFTVNDWGLEKRNLGIFAILGGTDPMPHSIFRNKICPHLISLPEFENLPDHWIFQRLAKFVEINAKNIDDVAKNLFGVKFKVTSEAKKHFELFVDPPEVSYYPGI